MRTLHRGALCLPYQEARLLLHVHILHPCHLAWCILPSTTCEEGFLETCCCTLSFCVATGARFEPGMAKVAAHMAEAPEHAVRSVQALPWGTAHVRVKAMVQTAPLQVHA